MTKAEQELQAQLEELRAEIAKRNKSSSARDIARKCFFLMDFCGPNPYHDGSDYTMNTLLWIFILGGIFGIGCGLMNAPLITSLIVGAIVALGVFYRWIADRETDSQHCRR